MLMAACEGIGPRGGHDTVHGAIFTDLHGGPPCDAASVPRELAGIGLQFRDSSGAVLGSTLTRTLSAEKLAPAPGDRAGDVRCRYAGLYEIALPVRPSYTVEFDVPDPPQRGAYFSGTDELVSQTISREALEGAGFNWSFELPSSYVVP